MPSASRKRECLAKADEAERQAAKVVDETIKEMLLKLAATYREMASAIEADSDS